MIRLILSFLFLLAPFGLMGADAPQIPPIQIPETGVGPYPDIASQAALLLFMSLLPFIVMLFTSFMKIVIVLALLRNAIGVQQTPPNMVINGIALILTVYVMYPTGLQMYEKARPILEQKLPTELVSTGSAAIAITLINETKEPFRDFLIRNCTQNHIDGFYKLTQKTFPVEVRDKVTKRDFMVVMPSFVTTQLKSAFEIGVLIYLPFFVIDLVTSNILLAMQMMMLSPLSIALPLKLLLLVMIDGWTILLEGLVLSFK